MASRSYRLALVAVLVCIICFAFAQDSKINIAGRDVASLSTQEIEEQLHVQIPYQQSWTMY
jgi:hypothetical protein